MVNWRTNSKAVHCIGQPCAWSAKRHSGKKSAQHIHWQIFRLFTPNVHFIRIRMRLSVKISAMSKYSQQKPLTQNSLKGQYWISLFCDIDFMRESNSKWIWSWMENYESIIIEEKVGNWAISLKVNILCVFWCSTPIKFIEMDSSKILWTKLNVLLTF